MNEATDSASVLKTKNQTVNTWTLLAMATTCGFAVANIYYNQPMLGEMARGVRISQAAVGAIPTATQIGYALGLLFLVPLGDKFERRRLILILIACLIAALMLAALAPNFWILVTASLLVGLFGTVAQQVVPMAAYLAPAEQKGRIVGLVMSGLLIGILGARTLSGLVAEFYGWRAMFWIAAALMILIALLVRSTFPKVYSTSNQSYQTIMISLAKLLKEEPVLREAALTGGFLFAAFSIFWSTLTLHLESSTYNYGPAVAGLFGLVGIVGALAAPIAGRFSDQVSPGRIVGWGILCALVSFLIFTGAGQFLIGLLTGVVLLDLGVQAAQIANQSRIYSLRPNAQSSLNALYMFVYFVGGAMGSILGSVSWAAGGWTRVGVSGCVVTALALLIHLGYSFSPEANASSTKAEEN